MTSEKSRKSSEVGSSGGQRRSDVTATEKSLSEVSAGSEDEKHPRDVTDILHCSAVPHRTAADTAFDSTSVPSVDDEFSACRPQWPWTATLKDNRQRAEILMAAKAYACDRGTVRALGHTQLAAGDRTTVDAWLEKLDGCDDPDVRSQYAEHLLRAVACGSMCVEPFWGRPPPCGPLRQLGARGTKQAVLLQQQYSGPPLTRSDSASLQRATLITRQTFYERQPIPEDGTICYAAAFSDMS